MDNFLGNRLAKISPLEREHLNRPVYMEEIEKAIKEPHQKVSARARLFYMKILPSPQSLVSPRALKMKGIS